MSSPDWIVLTVTLLGIIAYGLVKSRTTRDLDGYFLHNQSAPWIMVLLGIMGTQASAVTFLSAPGQAYTDGMRFVQIYFGLPLAMIVISIFFVPMFRQMKIYTAYEFLERRFDVKTRTLTSFLFLLQRGVSTGISVSAPAIILSSVLDWGILWTNIVMGGLLIIYTVTGGAKAVAYTQQLQLIIILAGMALAGYMVVRMLPQGVGFLDALHVSGKAGKLNVISTGFNQGKFKWSDTYNIWSGLIGGFFLALSYFGTDQAQVGRYLTAKSTRESRMGLLMNGLVKIPMQFLILLIGALVFAFYQFHSEPVFFNDTQLQRLAKSKYSDSLRLVQAEYDQLQSRKTAMMDSLAGTGLQKGTTDWNRVQALMQGISVQKEAARSTIRRWLNDKDISGNDNDTNYIFLDFVLRYLPRGLVGLLIAVIILAAWGSNAAALNSLASATICDFHRRFSPKTLSPDQEYKLSRWYTLAWGIFCIIVSMVGYNFGNSLIEAVNKLGSIFYGVMLGIFLVAFFLKRANGTTVFVSALISEAVVVLIQILNQRGVIGLSYLWLIVVGAGGVLLLSWLLSMGQSKKIAEAS